MKSLPLSVHAQLKIAQEVIALSVVMPYAVVCMRQPLKLNAL